MAEDTEKRIPGCLCQQEQGDSECPIHDDPKGHEWLLKNGLVFCRYCLVVRRADGQNKPCKGKVRISLRNRDG